MSADKPEGSGPDGRITPEDIRAKAEALAGGVEGSVQSAKPLLMYAAVGGALFVVRRFLLVGPPRRAPALDHRRDPPRVGGQMKSLLAVGGSAGARGAAWSAARGSGWWWARPPAVAVGPEGPAQGGRGGLLGEVRPGGAANHHPPRSQRATMGGVKVLLRNPRREVEVAGPVGVLPLLNSSVTSGRPFS